jgi:serine/threonine-protein kinase
VLKLAGTGGMGEVYQAWDTLLERYVALKAIRSGKQDTKEYRDRFRREAMSLAQLSHPNVCRVHDLLTTEDPTFMAMEWVGGLTLDQMGSSLTRKQKLHLILETAEGLAAAHATGLVHRDLKPQNLMVDPERHIKILDFGLAR